MRHIVELHGGTVGAESPGGGLGATFTVRLPSMDSVDAAGGVVSSHLDARGEPPALPSLEGVKVLAVDDEADARKLVTEILERCGAHVRTAASAGEAFELLRTWRPHVLLSDIGMPGADGYVLIRRVRELPAESGGETPAAALTAYGGAEDRALVLSSGFQRHVAKPVEPAELASVVASLVRQVDKASSD